MSAILLAAAALWAQKDPSSTKEAMRPVQLLVGEWRVNVTPEEDPAKGWEEAQAWEYKIDKEEYALQFSIKDGKKFKEGLLSYDLKKKVYRIEAVRVDGKKATFEGKLLGKELVLEEVAAEGAEAERLNFNFLRDIRFIGSIEKRAAGQKTWLESHQYQFTKAGVSIVRNEGPKCVVTGGTGTIAVEYSGKTYYVC
jgi:hypothetical protein